MKFLRKKQKKRKRFNQMKILKRKYALCVEKEMVCLNLANKKILNMITHQILILSMLILTKSHAHILMIKNFYLFKRFSIFFFFFLKKKFKKNSMLKFHWKSNNVTCILNELKKNAFSQQQF